MIEADKDDVMYALRSAGCGLAIFVVFVWVSLWAMLGTLR